MKKQPYPRALTRLTLVLLACSLTLWAGILCAVTYLHAVTIRNLAINNAISCTNSLSSHHYDNLNRVVSGTWDSESAKRSYYLYSLYYSTFWFSLDFNNFQTHYLPEGAFDDLVWPKRIEGESFIALTDPEGNIIAKQQSCIPVSYEDEEGNTVGYTVILLPEDFPEPDLPSDVKQTCHDFNLAQHFQLTGWFEDGYFVPTSIISSGKYGQGPREIIYERSQDIPDDAEIMVLNTYHTLGIWYYFGSSPVSCNGRDFTSLEELVKEFAQQKTEKSEGRMLAHYGLGTLVYLDCSSVPSLIEGKSNTIIYAARCSPLLTAIQSLTKVYIISLLAVLILVFALRSLIRDKLLQPMERVNDGISEGWSSIYDEDSTSPEWREPYELIQHYKETQDQLRWNKNEITRLNTALDYARDAEQNRRQMTSSIAHELKTPLAVIHSYAEGLKEHIAEGKREKYIDVILAESEHLDSMVLELLDLSRLEAGRVKLAADEFSLSALTHSVFERLEMAAQAKNLQVEYDFPENCTVTADEARIRQVIENFAANAVKYTPMNGKIHVKIKVDRYRTSPRASTTFSIENDSEPLSAEALSKVWDTFYRVDESRSGGGTGLGLAIAKNIVELHGGTCSVQNTKTGVMFQFSI